MIPKEPKIKKPYLAATVSQEVADLVEQEAEDTGNKSRIVEKALRLYFGLAPKPEQETKLAS
jgi:hypothetical protein